MRLKDKAIIVTGSTTGIGQAIARRCVAEGASVLIHGRDNSRGQAMGSELGDRTAFVSADLADPKAAGRIVEAALGAFGRIDCIVNNAASTARSDINTTDADFFDRTMAVNLRAPLLLIRAALPHLKESRGSVLNIGSVHAYCGWSNLLAYSISKGGLMTLTRNLADALARDGVRVNQLNVGWVLTDNEYKLKISDGFPADWPSHPPRDAVPAGRLLAPEEIASAAIYWLSDESRPVSGSVMEINQYPIIGRMQAREPG